MKAKIGSLVITLLLLVGCATPNASLVSEANRFVNTVGSEYETYVNNDEKLMQSEKDARVNHVETFRKALDAIRSEGGPR